MIKVPPLEDVFPEVSCASPGIIAWDGAKEMKFWKEDHAGTNHGRHGTKESSNTVYPITKPLLLQPIGLGLVIAPTSL